MKHKLWLFQIPTVLFFTACFYISQMGEKGELTNEFLRKNVFPSLQKVSGAFTNAKFQIRGETEPKNNIVIVEVDDQSLEAIGRWPWGREYIAALIDTILSHGAKVIGLDIVFAESNEKIPVDVKELMIAKGLGSHISDVETDHYLATALQQYGNQVVLGYASDQFCQPLYEGEEKCPINHPDVQFTPEEEKFRIKNYIRPDNFDRMKSPLISVINFISNINMFASAAQNAGTFQAHIDADGYIRRTQLVYLAGDNAYTMMPLEMAKVGLNDEIELKINEEGKVDSLRLVKMNRKIPVTPMGMMNINFRGGKMTFPYVSALEVLSEEPEIHRMTSRKPATVAKASLFKDAYVIIGVSALGVYDIRHFPHEENVPGVEGHANILDNILAGDTMVPSSFSGTHSTVWMLILMIIGALIFAYFSESLNALPALLLSVVVMGGFGLIDLKILFENNVNWQTSFFYLEIFAIFILTIAVKYVMEERQKKFIHSAFGRYISPAMVDTIVEDPTKLQLGGEKKELTILFSDIRGFTTLSEKMDAKHLAAFLNEYLGDMTRIIVNDYNGTLDKYIGDAIMAFWGAPIDQPDHGYRSVWAAIDMTRKLNEMEPHFRKEYGIHVAAGIGLHSGPVNVGNMGSEENFNYTVIGDHVNLASRLEGLTKYYGVNTITTRSTMDQIKRSGKEYPPYRDLDSVKVKGKKQAVELVEVIDRDLKELGLNKFKEARDLYNHQKWDDAIKLFTEVDELLRPNADDHDGPSFMFIDRCKYFKDKPPGSDWDGAWEMTSK